MCAVLLDEAEQLVGDVRLERRIQVRDAAVLRGLVGFSAGVGGRHDGLSDPVRRIVVTFIKLSMHKNAHSSVLYSEKGTTKFSMDSDSGVL